MKKEKEFKNEYLVFPQNILSPLTSNQRLGARLTPTIDDEKDSKIVAVYVSEDEPLCCGRPSDQSERTMV